MTSKEKAQELFDKNFEVTNNYYKAKECAVIAVNEIIDNCYEVMKPFWKEVKKEIELL